jgi:hypothetical protein
MGPNDAELVRVFTRRPGTAVIGDATVSRAAGFDVAVQAEAGQAIHQSGAVFATNIVVKDLSDDTTIAHTPANGFGEGSGAGRPDNLGSAGANGWPAPDREFEYNVAPGAIPAGKVNHVCQVIAWLRVGRTGTPLGPDSSFAVSPLFIIEA